MNIPYRKILVTLDGSELSKQALPHAEQLAQAMKAELILLRITPLPNPETAVVTGAPLDWSKRDAFVQSRVDEATRALQQVADSLNFRHVKTSAVVDVGEAAEKILAYVEKNAIDLVVMSTHGRTGVQRWLLGSVASKVASASPCPILLVRAT